MKRKIFPLLLITILSILSIASENLETSSGPKNPKPICGVTVTAPGYLCVNNDDDSRNEKWDFKAALVAGDDDLRTVSVSAFANEATTVELSVIKGADKVQGAGGIFYKLVKGEYQPMGNQVVIYLEYSGIGSNGLPLYTVPAADSTYYVQGALNSDEKDDVIFQAKLLCDLDGKPEEESEEEESYGGMIDTDKTTVYEVDLDLDSNNENKLERSQEEDEIEFSQVPLPFGLRPGQFIPLTSHKSDDKDVLADFADGFSLNGAEGIEEPKNVLDIEKFIPVGLTLKAPFEPGKTMVKFTFADSIRTLPEISANGLKLVPTTGDEANAFDIAVAKGGVRLWRVDQTARKSGMVVDKGDYIPMGEWLDWEAITQAPNKRTVKIYLEFLDEELFKKFGRQTLKIEAKEEDVKCEDKANMFLLPTEVVVDADNNNADNMPDTSGKHYQAAAKYESEEDLIKFPGKILFSQNGDIDRDGIMDVADGFEKKFNEDDPDFQGEERILNIRREGLNQGFVGQHASEFSAEELELPLPTQTEEDTPQTAPLTPLLVKIPKGIIDKVIMEVEYEASDPKKMTRELKEGRYHYVLPEEGNLRLWTVNRHIVGEDPEWTGADAKTDDFLDDKGKAPEGVEPGDFIPKKIEITEKGFRQMQYSEKHGAYILWVESVKTSKEIRDQKINFKFYEAKKTAGGVVKGSEILREQTVHFTSLNMNLISLNKEDGSGEAATGEISASASSPIIDVKKMKVSKPYYGEVKDLTADLSDWDWVSDVELECEITSEFLDTIAEQQGGVIKEAFLYTDGVTADKTGVNKGPGAGLRAILPVSFTKGFNPSSKLAPFPYKGTIKVKLRGVRVTEGINTFEIRTADSTFKLDGFSKHSFTVSLPKVPEEIDEEFEYPEDDPTTPQNESIFPVGVGIPGVSDDGEYITTLNAYLFDPVRKNELDANGDVILDAHGHEVLIPFTFATTDSYDVTAEGAISSVRVHRSTLEEEENIFRSVDGITEVEIIPFRVSEDLEHAIVTLLKGFKLNGKRFVIDPCAAELIPVRNKEADANGEDQLMPFSFASTNSYFVKAEGLDSPLRVTRSFVEGEENLFKSADGKKVVEISPFATEAEEHAKVTYVKGFVFNGQNFVVFGPVEGIAEEGSALAQEKLDDHCGSITTAVYIPGENVANPNHPYWQFFRVAISEENLVEKSDGGEYHPHVWEFAGPIKLIESFTNLRLEDVSRTVIDQDVPGGTQLIQFEAPIKKVKMEIAERYRREQEARDRAILANAVNPEALGIVAFKAADQEYAKTIADEFYAAVSRVKSENLYPKSKLDFAKGFAVGLGKGGFEMVGGIGDGVKMVGKVLYKAGKAYVRGIGWGLRVLWKTATGQSIEKEKRQAAEVIARARRFGQAAHKKFVFFKELAGQGVDAIGSILTGDFDKLNKLSGPLRQMISMSIEIFVGMLEQYSKKNSYGQGVMMGKATFDIGSFFIPGGAGLKAIQIAGKISKAKFLTQLGKTSKFFKTNPIAVKALQKQEPLKKALVNGSKCFVAGTLIATAHAESESVIYKPIEEVRVGDTVWSWSESSKKISKKKVSEKFVNVTYSLTSISVDTDNDGVADDKITGTPEHPFWSVSFNNWKPMGKIVIGERLLVSSGGFVTVISTNTQDGLADTKTFNFNVADNHTYIVGQKNLIVHNTCPEKAKITSYLQELKRRKNLDSPEKVADSRIENLLEVKKDLRDNKETGKKTGLMDDRNMRLTAIDGGKKHTLDYACGLLAKGQNVKDRLGKITSYNGWNKYFPGRTRKGTLRKGGGTSDSDVEVNHIIPKQWVKVHNSSISANGGIPSIPMLKADHRAFTDGVGGHSSLLRKGSPFWEMSKEKQLDTLLNLYVKHGENAQAKILKDFAEEHLNIKSNIVLPAVKCN